jgi:ribosome maturation factor RimP
MILKENIENWARQALLNESQFLVDVVVSSKQGPQKVTVMLDGDHGITIDDCAAISRKLLSVLEGQGDIGDNFTLEVTTPGVDHPLKMKRQYIRNIGRMVKVQRTDKTVEQGKLAAVNEDTLALEREEKNGKVKELRKIVVPFSEIERAIVQISFK